MLGARNDGAHSIVAIASLRGEHAVTKRIFGIGPTRVRRGALQDAAWLLRACGLRWQIGPCAHCPPGVFAAAGRAGRRTRIRQFCSGSLRKQHMKEESHQ
ncbi:hypothetical protein GCM10007320_32420 [Pseudorhodoferax aquiterrae]|uniref:Uncharacterized protein n=1 Tax=Pseudorhodoferax aquiterrae TaxID=747304 RepID=A0ABQ3G3P8_9BURK|nr:hypothetical protein GCM10007320_32420 [Pseudorhodoferax aquiterrae]